MIQHLWIQHVCAIAFVVGVPSLLYLTMWAVYAYRTRRRLKKVVTNKYSATTCDERQVNEFLDIFSK